MSVGAQDIYYGLIESEKESYNFLESNLDKVLGKESYSILNYVSGNSTAYTSQVKSTYYDSNPIAQLKELEKNNLHHTVPSKEGSLMIENKWNGDPSELKAAQYFVKKVRMLY